MISPGNCWVKKKCSLSKIWIPHLCTVLALCYSASPRPPKEQVTNDEKDAEIAKAKRDCEAYQELLKEKDASIGELQKSVRNGWRGL